MKQFTSSIRKSILDGNHFGALFVALAMPDICGALEIKKGKDEMRYKYWFEKYLNSKYNPRTQLEFTLAYFPQVAAILNLEMRAALDIPFDQKLTFTADDCYRCRCRCLHEGVLRRVGPEKFIFLSGLPKGTILHRKLKDGQLVIQVESFVEDICLGVEAWEQDVRNDSAIVARFEKLLAITEWYNL